MQDTSKLYFTPTDEWIRFLGEDQALLGISGYGSEFIKDCISINFPNIGKAYHKGDLMMSVHSVSINGDIFAPFDCVVLECNKELLEHPNLLVENAYQNWILKVGIQGTASQLLSYEEYLKALR